MKVLLLILVCLLPVHFAHPMADHDTSSQRPQSSDARIHYKAATFLIFEDMYLYMLNGISQVFGNVTDKSQLVENPSKELTRHLASFTQFIVDVRQITHRIKNLNKLIGLGKLMKRMDNITREYELDVKLHPDQIPASLSLFKNGLEAYKTKILSKLAETGTELFNVIDAYVSSGLTPDEAKEDEKLMNWYHSYKNKTDIQSTSILFWSYAEEFSRLTPTEERR